jgi:hypothetical protein
VARRRDASHASSVRNRAVHTPAPSTVAITSPIGERTRQRVPRRIEHFQGELTTLEQRVMLHADGRIGFAEIAKRLGISEQEVVAVALSLSGLGAIVLTAVPPPLPKRPASGTRPKVTISANEQVPEVTMAELIEIAQRAEITEITAPTGLTRIPGIAGVAEMAEVQIEVSEPEIEIEVDLDLSELERLIRPPTRR